MKNIRGVVIVVWGGWGVTEGVLENRVFKLVFGGIRLYFFF